MSHGPEEPFDLDAARQIANVERERLRQEAPTTRLELEGWLIYAIGLPMAALYENARPIFRGPHEARNRFEALWKNDETFRHAVRQALSSTMLLLDNLDRRLGRPILR